jgi:hypothetical protein
VCAAPGCIEEGSLRCARCKAVFYCCRQCQQSHWKKHKKQCSMPKVRAPLPTEPQLEAAVQTMHSSHAARLAPRGFIGLRRVRKPEYALATDSREPAADGAGPSGASGLGGGAFAHAGRDAVVASAKADGGGESAAETVVVAQPLGHDHKPIGPPCLGIVATRHHVEPNGDDLHVFHRQACRASPPLFWPHALTRRNLRRLLRRSRPLTWSRCCAGRSCRPSRRSTSSATTAAATC